MVIGNNKLCWRWWIWFFSIFGESKKWAGIWNEIICTCTVLSLKKDFNQARHYYDVYLTSKHVNNDIGVIMDSVWNGKAKSELVAESVKNFKNPVLRKLFCGKSYFVKRCFQCPVFLRCKKNKLKIYKWKIKRKGDWRKMRDLIA